MGTTGLSASPTEYRERLRKQSDEQLDAWAAELLRDVAKRRGVIKAVADVRKSVRLDEPAFRRVFARGGGAPSTIGLDAEGNLIVPSIALHFVVSGLRVEAPDARERLIDYIAAGYHEIVYV